MRVITLLCLIALLSACNQGSDNPAIAIVDVDTVAERLGRYDPLEQKIQSVNQKLTEELQSIARALQAQVDAEKERLGKNPKQEELQKLKAMVAEANQRVLGYRQFAEQKSQRYQNWVIVDFRKEVATVASDIARKMGAKAVITVNDSLLWVDPTIDITKEVIVAMGGDAVSATAPPVEKETKAPATN